MTGKANFTLSLIPILAVVCNVIGSEESAAQRIYLADIHHAQWWNEPYVPPHKETPKNQKLSFVKVRSNTFIDDSGDVIIFKGVSISDPDKIVKNGRWNKRHFRAIKNWGANTVRIPIHPIAVRQRGLAKYLELIDEAVKWCEDLKLYVILDWHSIGNLHMEMFQADMYETSMRETLYFWKVVSRRYAGNSTVAFYEIFNEPTVWAGTMGKCSWEQWKKINEDIIDVIYAHDRSVIPLVAGFNWAYDLRGAKNRPIEREGIAYTVHPYPGKCTPPREPHWDKHFGFLASKYPIFATELGYYFEGEQNLIEDGTYRDAIMNYFDKHKISWCAWVFDPDWVPQLIENFNYAPTHSGAFFKNQMLEKRE